MSDSATKDSAAEIQYPPSVLDDVTKLVQRVQTFTGATGAAIALREGEEMVCRASRGTNAPDVGMVLSLDGTFAGLAVTGMKAVRCEDTENDPRVDPEISRALRIKSMAVVPVLSGMRVTGVIAVFSSTGNAFSDTHMAVLKTMADGLGAGILRWMESQGISSLHASPSAVVVHKAIPAIPKPEPPRAVEPVRATPVTEMPAPAPRVEAPKPAAVAATPKPEVVEMKPVAAASTAVAAAPAPVVEQAPEVKPVPPQPKKQEPKQQGKWKPVAPPKQEEVVEKPAAKPEVKAQPKPEPPPKPKSEPVAVPSFSYEANPDGGKKSPIVFVGIAAAVLVVAGGGYFLFGHSSKHAASPAPTAVSEPAPPIMPAPTTATPAATTPTSTAASKLDSTKTVGERAAERARQEPEVVVTKAAPAPMVIAPSTGSKQSQVADMAPPSIALAGGAGPGLDVPVTSSAPKLSAPAPANAVIVQSHLIQHVNPIYPQAAKQYRIEGAVTLNATIGADGRVHQAQIISGPPMLRDAAISAVKQWKYAPSTVNGRPVESSVRVVLDFKMPL